MASAAQTGKDLLRYMCSRLDIDDLSDCDILDIGCGVRFCEAIINLNIDVRSYTGIDVFPKVVDFLRKEIHDPRFEFFRVNAYNPMYCRSGEKGMSPYSYLRQDIGTFDIVCMFSVITHQRPEEASILFEFSRDRIRDTGKLFFSAFVHDDSTDFYEREPGSPGLMCSYSHSYLAQLLKECGWSVRSIVPPLPEGLPIMHSIFCVPEN